MKKIQLLTLKFHKFKLLKLSSIQTITIDFRRRFHWFVGTNGSGKSSIVEEASPLAADMSLYFEGGFREQMWQVDDKQYITLSTRGAKKHTHSLCLVHPDGSREELNPGHTVTVYKALAESIFGTTKESHSIAIGKRTHLLTRMDPGARKSLFTALATSDYTYALGYYKRLFKSFRDLQGSLNVDKERLVELKVSVVSGDEEKTCLAEIQGFKKQVELLMDARPNVSEPEHVVKQKIAQTQAEIKRLYVNFLDFSKKNKHLYPLESEEYLRSHLAKLEVAYAANESSIDSNYRAFEEATKTRESYLQNSIGSREVIQERLETLNGQLLAMQFRYLSSTVDTSKALSDCIEAQASYPSVRDTIFPMDAEDVYNEPRIRLTLNDVANDRFLLNQQVATKAREIEDVKSHEHDPTIECPKCNHKFNPTFNKLRLSNLEEDLTNLKQKLDKANKVYEEMSSELSRIERFKRGQDVWHQYIRKYPSLNDLWSFVMDEKLHHLDPFAIEQHFTLIKIEILRKIEEVKIQEEVAEIRKKLEWNAHVDSNKLKDIESEIVRLQKVLEESYEKRSSDLEELRRYKAKVIVSKNLKSDAERAEVLKKSLEELIVKDYDHMERSVISDFIRNLDVEISSREQRLRQLMTKNAEMIRLEQGIALSERKVKALRDAMTALSPSEGLIARGLTGFINHFTSLMNTVMARISTYRMEIPPLRPSEEDFELDFKIPITITSTDGTVLEPPDISECSMGQEEIINLAFRILYLKFKGLDGGILPLDEFGSHLDHTHKQKAFEAVKQILNISSFSQVFMVSHLANTYGLMEEAGVTVLCPANVVIPDGVAYNDTTEIIRC